MCGVPYLGVRMLQVLGGRSPGRIMQWPWGAQGGKKLCFTKGSNASLFGFPCRHHNANQLPGSTLGVSIPAENTSGCLL